MAIDFPNSPSVGQIFTSGDKSWIWDGTVWEAYGAFVSPTVLKVDSTNSRVGINNQSPATALDIVGTTTVRAASTQDGVALAGRAGGTSTYEVTLTPTTLTADRTLTLPDATGTVALTSDPGLVLIKTQEIGSGVSSVVISDVFSSTYDNYFVQISNSVASANQPNVSMRLGSTTTNYAYSGHYMSFGSTTLTGDVSTVGPSWPLGVAGNGTTGNGRFSFDCTVRSPNLAQATFFSAQNASLSWQTVYAGFLNNTTQYTAFTILPSSGTLTGGTIRVYGYRNS